MCLCWMVISSIVVCVNMFVVVLMLSISSLVLFI